MQHASIYLIIFLLFPLSAANANAEEDIVGDILEKEGIPRNPPEQDATGEISSFDEGPVVIQSVPNETNATG